MLHVLTADQLHWTCPQEWLAWETSADVEPATTIVGQDRAVEAIGFGLAMRGIGYNVFVTGLAGTGRLTTIKSFLDGRSDGERRPDDVCFAYRFRTPEKPRAIMVAAGKGRVLRDGVDELIRDLAAQLPALFNDRQFRQQVERATADLEQQERETVSTFEAEVREAGFVLVQMQAGPVTHPEVLPIVGEEPVAMEELPRLVEEKELTEEQADGMRDRHESFAERLHDVFETVSDLRRRQQKRVVAVRRTTVKPLIHQRIVHLRKTVDEERAEPFLKGLEEDLERHHELFLRRSASAEGPEGDGNDAGREASEDADEGDRFLRWRVNLAVDNADTAGAPVILETEPTYSNLFGTIERVMTSSGEVRTSHMRIRAGSLLRANGGFLVLNAEDVLQEERVWAGLKRALRFQRVRIQPVESMVLGASALRPEEVPLSVKVVIIGSRSIYDLLYAHDADFPKIFKVLADFDSVMTASAEAVGDILSVLRRVSDAEGLLPMDRSGMAAILAQAARLGQWRRRLSSRFSDLADVLREASFVASRRQATLVSAEDVREARKASRRRHGLSEDRTHDFVEEGLVRVETEGAVIGQVNGLAVYDLGHHRFGKPSRITARIGLGREGVVNIERQAGLSGPIHDKGMQILSGLLRGTFARKVPLAMACSITFEQAYGGIDGDSASSTEVYAVLSALSELPLRQDVAVTGSVDQLGRVQSIGGVNEKIEGFFRVCASRGLTGTQGVMVPSSNVDDLHLDAEVCEAVRESRFHVWSVDTIEDGIELLTGIPAGSWEDDAWTPGSVLARCQARVDEMSRLMRRALRPVRVEAETLGPELEALPQDE